MSLLPDNCRWWRYPVKAQTAPDLNHCGKRRPLYPVRRFTSTECAAYVIAEWRGLRTDDGAVFDTEIVVGANPAWVVRQARLLPLNWVSRPVL
jgi:hypothetical protein